MKTVLWLLLWQKEVYNCNLYNQMMVKPSNHFFGVCALKLIGLLL